MICKSLLIFICANGLVTLELADLPTRKVSCTDWRVKPEKVLGLTDEDGKFVYRA